MYIDLIKPHHTYSINASYWTDLIRRRGLCVLC